MADDKKAEQIKLFEELGIDKFNSVEDLAKSYKELEKAQSQAKPSKESSLDDVLSKTEKFFKNSPDSSLEGGLGKLSKSIREATKVDGRLADEAAKLSAGIVAKTIREGNREGVTSVLKDEANRVAIEQYLGTKEAVDKFNSEYHKGLISPREAALMVKLGGASANKEAKEGTPNLNAGKTASEADIQAAGEELMAILGNVSHPYFTGGPNQEAAKKQVANLKKKIGMA